jgi:hypothetical protein
MSDQSGPSDGLGDEPGSAEAGRQEERLPLVEERAVVSVRETEETVVPVRVRTREHAEEVNETLRRQQVDVRRVPVDRIVEAAPEPRSEDGTTIYPVVEEVMVRRYRVIEELHVRISEETREHRESVTLRRQEAEIDDAVVTTRAEASPDTA